MQNSESEPSPDRLRILIANDPLAYRDVLGKAIDILRPDWDIRVLRADLQVEIDRYRPDVLIQNADTSELKIRVYPPRSVGSVPGVRSAEVISDHSDFAGLLQVIDRALQTMLRLPPAEAGM